MIKIKNFGWEGSTDNMDDWIEDFFKYRTCENCAYVLGNDAIGGGVYTASYCGKSSIEVGTVKKDFGCNEFERKLN